MFLAVKFGGVKTFLCLENWPAKQPQRIISNVYFLLSVINAYGMWGAVRGVTPLRSIRMRESAFILESSGAHAPYSIIHC
jgi:hypothetical protein